MTANVPDYRKMHRAMTPAEKLARQQLLDDQVSFIITTRDNNKPNIYGQTSTTHGPLPWSAVADAYNEKYNVSVTQAAMEKRAREHRNEWLAKHPSYPTDIVYAKKVKAPRTSVPGGIAKAGAQRVSGSVQNGVHNAMAPNLTVNFEKGSKATHAKISNERVGGWLPSEYIRDQADVEEYIKSSSINVVLVNIEVVDAQGASLGTVTVDREAIRFSSAVLRYCLDNNTEMKVQLRSSSMDIVRWYIHCVSLDRKAVLSEYGYRTGASLMELYCLATDLGDDHVRELVLHQWRLLKEQKAEVEIGLDDLNLLFESTERNDPAREFWSETVCAAGLAGQLLSMKACHPALATQVRTLAERELIET